MLKSAAKALAFGLWLIASMAPGRVHAQDELREDERHEERYEDIVTDALAEFRAGHFLEARNLFARAHDLRPSARTLRGMGQAAFGAQLYARAIVDLTAALSSEVNRLPPKLRDEAEQIVTRARAYCGRFWLTLDPPGAELTVDGASPVFDRDGALLLDVGVRHLTLRAEGRTDRETTIQVVGGEDKKLAFSAALDRRANDEDAAADSEPQVAEDAPTHAGGSGIQLEPRTRPRSLPPEEHPFPWLAVGSFGVSAVGLGVGFWHVHLRDARISSWLKNGCSSKPNDPTCEWFHSKWRDATTWEIISFSMAGAFAATGVVLLIVNGNSDDSSETSVACGGMGDIGVSCQLRM